MIATQNGSRRLDLHIYYCQVVPQAIVNLARQSVPLFGCRKVLYLHRILAQLAVCFTQLDREPFNLGAGLSLFDRNPCKNADEYEGGKVHRPDYQSGRQTSPQTEWRG